MNRGFTLLEVMVALAIAATALVALMGRVGASADIQYDLTMQAEAMSVAVNELERIKIAKNNAGDAQGEVETTSGVFQWKATIEQTADDGFVRQNMLVTAPDGGTVTLFLYRDVSQ